jgi:hypothetical protein
MEPGGIKTGHKFEVSLEFQAKMEIRRSELNYLPARKAQDRVLL